MSLPPNQFPPVSFCLQVQNNVVAVEGVEIPEILRQLRHGPDPGHGFRILRGVSPVKRRRIEFPGIVPQAQADAPVLRVQPEINPGRR